ncbi:MAG: taurine dioxygenase [Gammaproteobacteria bacterium]|jgi:taurine dioxygenase
MNTFKRITVQPLSGALGAEIDGISIADGVDDETIAEVRQALLDHQVIFFRDQQLNDDTHKAFTARFGTIFVHPNYDLGQGDPEIVRLVREPGDSSVAGEEWHTDTTMMAQPPMGSMLYALDVPPYGADTLFANQYLAYEALSHGMKAMLSTLKAVHSDILVAGPQAAKNSKRSSKVREDDSWQPTENAHPVVAVHPETGRKSLYVNIAYTLRFEGMSAEESKPLLNYLFEHGNRPQFTCRFAWRKGSIAFWDNRCTKHLALNDVPQFPRRMQRVQVAGKAIV